VVTNRPTLNPLNSQTAHCQSFKNLQSLAMVSVLSMAIPALWRSIENVLYK